MHHLVEVFPLILALVVGLELRMTLGPLEAHFLGDGDDVGKEQRIHALALVFGQDGHEEEVNDFGALEVDGLQQVPPPEGEELALGLLERVRERTDAHAHGHRFALGVFDDGEQAQTCARLISLNPKRGA